MDEHIAVTVDGRSVTVQSVSDVLIAMLRKAVEKEFRDKGIAIDPPTYAVSVAGGETVTEPHNETTLQTDEEREAWKQYLVGSAQLNREQRKRVLEFKLRRGVVCDLPENTKWEDDQRKLGIDIPTDPDEKRYHYITTEILKTTEDMLRVLQVIDTLTYKNVISEDEIAAAIDNFRYHLQRKTIQPRFGKTGQVAVGDKAE